MPVKGLRPQDIEVDSIKNATFWFVSNPETDEYVATPDSENGDTMVLFLKKEEADHWAHILVKGTPAYKGKQLIVESEPFQSIFEYSLGVPDMRILPVGPVEAKKLFEEYPDFLRHYYGIKN